MYFVFFIVNMSKKRDDIVLAARELFWKHGFKRVSVEEICERAHVSKMTFYKHFENKIELAKAVYDKEVSKGMTIYKAILEEDATPAEKMKKMLLLKLEGTNNISQEFLVDFYRSPELGLDFIEGKVKELMLMALEDSKKAQEKGIFRNDIKPEFLLYISNKITEMMTDEKLLKLYNTPQELIIELSNFFVYGVSPHD